MLNHLPTIFVLTK